MLQKKPSPWQAPRTVRQPDYCPSFGPCSGTTGAVLSLGTPPPSPPVRVDSLSECYLETETDNKLMDASLMPPRDRAGASPLLHPPKGRPFLHQSYSLSRIISFYKLWYHTIASGTSRWSRGINVQVELYILNGTGLSFPYNPMFPL